MYMDQTGYFGMHFFWWIFSVFLLVSSFSFLSPIRKSRLKKLRENPKDILQRRLASGEISEQEYAKSKELLARDSRHDLPEKKSTKINPNQPAHN